MSVAIGGFLFGAAYGALLTTCFLCVWSREPRAVSARGRDGLMEEDDDPCREDGCGCVDFDPPDGP